MSLISGLPTAWNRNVKLGIIHEISIMCESNLSCAVMELSRFYRTAIIYNDDILGLVNHFKEKNSIQSDNGEFHSLTYFNYRGG